MFDCYMSKSFGTFLSGSMCLIVCVKRVVSATVQYGLMPWQHYKVLCKSSYVASISIVRIADVMLRLSQQLCLCVGRGRHCLSTPG